MRETTKKPLLFAAAMGALVLCACPGPSGNPDGGRPDANDIDPGDIRIKVSGTAHVHPAASAWLQSQGKPVPPLSGLTLRVEEPLKVALGDPLGTFGTVTLDSSGAFSVPDVRVELVNLGIATGIFDGADGGSCASDGGVDAGCAPRVIRSATAIYDVALEGQKPDKDISGAKGYAVPSAFHDLLTQAVTEARIKSITSNQKSTLIGAGFMLGRIVDAQGNPVAGAKVVTQPSSRQQQIFYPSADYANVTQDSTSPNGVFVFVHNGGSVDQFKFSIDGKPEYLLRNAGAAHDACLVVTVYPGKTPPP